MLTAAEIEQKTFSTALRGYDLDEVDDFLDEIVATIRELSDQLEAAQAAAAGAPSPPPALVAEEEVSAVAPSKKVDESAIARALIAAQTAADKMLEDAREAADKIMDGAKGEADTWAAERAVKRAEAINEIAALAARVASVRTELSVLAGEVSGKLDEMDDVIEGVELTQSGDMPGSEADTEETGEPTTHWGAHTNHQAVVASSYPSSVEPSDAGEPEQKAESSAELPGEPDKLDDMLNGVADDLRLGTDDGDQESDEDR